LEGAGGHPALVFREEDSENLMVKRKDSPLAEIVGEVRNTLESPRGVVPVRLSDSERERISRAAEAGSLAFSSFVRWAALQAPPISYVRQGRPRSLTLLSMSRSLSAILRSGFTTSTESRSSVKARPGHQGAACQRFSSAKSDDFRRTLDPSEQRLPKEGQRRHAAGSLAWLRVPLDSRLTTRLPTEQDRPCCPVVNEGETR
jgi:hypothetical protein